MATFELDQDRTRDRDQVAVAAADTRRIKQECIIAFKVYDQCRHPYSKIH